MNPTTPSTELVRRRYSCRIYSPQAIAAHTRASFIDYLGSLPAGPFGTRARFALIAATDEDRASLRGLGTYGFIRDPPGFVVGAVERNPQAFEDFGYLLERVILHATDQGLGTCWLGGSFTKSRFARTIGLTAKEWMPAVASIGYAASGSKENDRIRQRAGSSRRLPASTLFFEDVLGGKPSLGCAAGPYAEALEAVRWAPSASNRQPWRIVHTDTGWHFYLVRTPGYGAGSLVFSLLRLADLQRVDLGIAMCHFETVLRDQKLPGSWITEDPCRAGSMERAVYVATWRQAG